MKKSALFLVALLCMALLSASCFAGDKIIPVEQLPAAAQQFVKTNFPNAKISFATKDAEFIGTKYEARLADWTEINFDKKGEWDKVDCQMNSVPEALVPAAIAEYVKTNFAGTKIVKIDKEHGGYEVELSNDIELKFNQSGALVGMDD